MQRKLNTHTYISNHGNSFEKVKLKLGLSEILRLLYPCEKGRSDMDITQDQGSESE